MGVVNPEVYCVLVKVVKPEATTARRGYNSEPVEPERFFKTFNSPEKVIEYISSDMESSYHQVEKILKIDHYANISHMTIVFKGKLQLVPTLSTEPLGW